MRFEGIDPILIILHYSYFILQQKQHEKWNSCCPTLPCHSNTFKSNQSIFSVFAEVLVDARPDKVLSIVTDISKYNNWSTYHTKCVHHTPLTMPRPLQIGDKLIVTVHLKKGGPGNDQIDVVSHFDESQFAVTSSPFPDWLLWAEKVHRVEQIADNQTKFSIWITMGGAAGLAPWLVQSLKAEELRVRFEEYCIELKAEAEKGMTQ